MPGVDRTGPDDIQSLIGCPACGRGWPTDHFETIEPLGPCIGCRLEVLYAKSKQRQAEDGGVWPEYTGDGI